MVRIFGVGIGTVAFGIAYVGAVLYSMLTMAKAEQANKHFRRISPP